jgi:hypothetical protein
VLDEHPAHLVQEPVAVERPVRLLELLEAIGAERQQREAARIGHRRLVQRRVRGRVVADAVIGPPAPLRGPHLDRRQRRERGEARGGQRPRAEAGCGDGAADGE